ncbi:MAG: hypothetical protein GY926_15160 [bacterium]|nr:hypothetical protein [bacterium]
MQDVQPSLQIDRRRQAHGVLEGAYLVATKKQNRSRAANGRFAQGKSGNPAGRPKGSRNKTTLAAQALLEGQAEKLTQKAIDRALDGDSVALRLCMERIVPIQRERTIQFDLPKLDGLRDLTEAFRNILAAVAEGIVAPVEAEKLASIIQVYRDTIHSEELEQRVEKLEQQEDEVLKAFRKWQ